jgi:hypothetical protein
MVNQAIDLRLQTVEAQFNSRLAEVEAEHRKDMLHMHLSVVFPAPSTAAWISCICKRKVAQP